MGKRASEHGLRFVDAVGDHAHNAGDDQQQHEGIGVAQQVLEPQRLLRRRRQLVWTIAVQRARRRDLLGARTIMGKPTERDAL